MPVPVTQGQLRTKLEDMQIGDYISCRYKAASGAVGLFSELGTCTAAEIPVTGTATPDGLFYFIKADKGLLIADRVIQHSISWNTINAVRLIEGTPNKCAAVFNGTNAYMAVAHNTNLHVSKITLRARVYEQDWNITGSHEIVSKFEAGGYGLLIRELVGEGNIGAAIRISSAYRSVKIPLSSLASGWHEFVCTYDGTILKLFVDGELRDSLEITGSIEYSYNNSLMFGCDPGTGSSPSATPFYFAGKISEVALWSDGLTDEEVQNLSGKEIPLDFRNLVSLWDFSFVTDRVYDKKSNNHAVPINVVFESLNESNMLIRSLSGGCAYADANGNATTSDQNLGGWPTTNEWDTYIVNSNLNGKVTPGDDSVWHWSNLYSWTTDTPITSIGSNANRVYRGKDSSNKLLQIASSTANTTIGFRPVLEYIEPDGSSKQTTLWY